MRPIHAGGDGLPTKLSTETVNCSRHLYSRSRATGFYATSQEAACIRGTWTVRHRSVMPGSHSCRISRLAEPAVGASRYRPRMIAGSPAGADRRGGVHEIDQSDALAVQS